MSTPLELINITNTELKRPQVTAPDFSKNSFNNFSYAQLQALNFILIDIDRRDKKWGFRNASYTLTTDSDVDVNAAGFSLEGQNITLNKITNIRHSDNYLLDPIGKDQFERYVNPTRNFLQEQQSGKPRKWYAYQSRLFLVEDIPNSAQDLYLFYQARLAARLTVNDLNSPTAIVYPLEDENVIIKGLAWRSKAILYQSDAHPNVLAAEQKYEQEIIKSSICDTSEDEGIRIDPYFGEMLNSDQFEMY